MHARITPQYTMPVVIGPSSPVVTDTMTSSSRVTPAAVSPSGDQRLTLAERAERVQVGVVEPIPDVRRREAQLMGVLAGRRHRALRRNEG